MPTPLELECHDAIRSPILNFEFRLLFGFHMLGMHIFLGLDQLKSAFNLSSYYEDRETVYTAICFGILVIPIINGYLTEKLSSILPSCILKAYIVGYLLLTVPYPLICCMALKMTATNAFFLQFCSLMLTMKLISFHHV